MSDAEWLKWAIADEIKAIGFAIDAFAGCAKQEIDAGRLHFTDELDALLAVRDTVKTRHPKP